MMMYVQSMYVLCTNSRDSVSSKYVHMYVIIHSEVYTTSISQLLRNYHINESADSALHSIIHHYCVIPATTAH